MFVKARIDKDVTLASYYNLLECYFATNDVANAINEVKGGKIAFKVDKVGIIHASIGRVSFAPEKIAENSL